MKRFIFLFMMFINALVASEKQSTANSENNSNEKNSSGCVSIFEQLNLLNLNENNNKENKVKKQPASLLLTRRLSFKSNPEVNKDEWKQNNNKEKYLTFVYLSNVNKKFSITNVIEELKQPPEIITIAKSKNGQTYKEVLEWLLHKNGCKNVVIEYEKDNCFLKEEQQKKSPRKFSSDL